MAVNWEELRKPVPKEALQFRPGTRNKERTKAMVLAYIDANYVADLLDSVVGPENWRLPEPVEVTLNGIPAVKRALVIRVDGEWIEKWEYGYPNSIRDGAVQDDEPLKSAASDALKRCAWMWGVGRELRRSPHVWWALDEWGRFAETDRLAEEYWRRATGQGPGHEEPAAGADEPELTSPMGLCPVHRIPFVHKVGTRRDGTTYDFWGCPRKNPDGSWFYARDASGHWIDGFHTGYVIESLLEVVAGGEAEFEPVLARGVRFYLEEMFTSDFLPRYTPDSLFPIEVQNCAEAVQALAKLARRGRCEGDTTARRTYRSVIS